MNETLVAILSRYGHRAGRLASLRRVGPNRKAGRGGAC